MPCTYIYKFDNKKKNEYYPAKVGANLCTWFLKVKEISVNNLLVYPYLYCPYLTGGSGRWPWSERDQRFAICKFQQSKASKSNCGGECMYIAILFCLKVCL